MTIMAQSDKRNQNVKMTKDLRSLINTYHFTNEKKEHTHTFFGENRIKKLSVPPEAREEFYRSYVSYCNKATKDLLEKKGLNSITEKAKTVNQFYIDLDFKIEHFAQGLVTIENVGTLMNTIKNMFLTVLQEALGKIDLYCVTAFRGMYKCHLYFPNIPLTGNQSEQICRDVET